MKLCRLTLEQLRARRRAPVDAAALAAVTSIVAEVRDEGEPALRRHAERFGDLAPGAPLMFSREALAAASREIAAETRELLTRTAARIRTFAQAQRAALRDVELPLRGGVAGHRFEPLARAGCYAPAGRHPLPSSVLMTVIPARVAGVRDVVVASPRPSALMLAAAAVADADQLLAVGGAQAIAALAYGAGAIAPCDVVVGPGNRFVTAAKQCVAADVAIDFLAGPSELLVVADDSADARVVAADLLAQAEHDEEAQPLLLARHESIVAAVERELERQLPTLATAATARAALESHGGAILAKDADEALRIVDAIAPEHLELHVRDADDFGARVRHFGALFVGARSAEVLGDYGAGPNHVLPTGGSARFRGGLSVLDFLRARTWLRMDESGDNDELARDAVALARLEGLEGHARAAELRIGSPRAARTR